MTHSSSGSAPLRIAVVGAGAVGCYFGGMLARAGHRVTLIARPAHVDAMQAHGLHMQTKTFDEHVSVGASADISAIHNAQFVLFCVKSTDTESAATLARPHLSPDAVVLSLQNGVDNAERLRRLLPDHVVAAAVVYVASEMVGPGHVKHLGRGELVIEPFLSVVAEAHTQLRIQRHLGHRTIAVWKDIGRRRHTGSDARRCG